jgi:RNA polymerase sigma-70 factor (ECF subfamily)
MDGNDARVRGINDVWHNDRDYLLAMASRMLHGRVDHEDVVQEAFGRLAGADLDELDDVRGWLMVVVRRLCLDHLHSAHARRESGVGWLADGELPMQRQPQRDPADLAILDNEIQFALALVLDRLTPAQRTSFVLHDVFRFPFDAVAAVVGRTPMACRQLASRARRLIRAGDRPAQGDVEVSTLHVVTERFIAACQSGELTELMAVLDPGVHAETILLRQGSQNRVEGRPVVAKRVLELAAPGANRALFPVPLERTPGVVSVEDGSGVAVLELHERNGVVHLVRTHYEPRVDYPPR